MAFRLGNNVSTICSVDCVYYEGEPRKLAEMFDNHNLLGDGTVTIHSASINGLTPSNKTFVKTNDPNNNASHCGMIDGHDSITLNFLVEIVSDSYSTYTNAELLSQFGFVRGGILQ